MKSDIQIAQEAIMLPIKEVAEKLGIGEDDLELYGKYKAKLSDEPNPLEIKQVTLEDHIFTVTGQDEETLRFYRLSDDVIYAEDENGQFTKRFEADTDWSDFQNLPRIKR